MTALQSQLVIGDRYRALEIIGSGQGAQVYRGEDIVLKRPIALKIVSPAMQQVYHNALSASSRIGHPAFVGVFDALEFDDQAVIVQEFMQGARFLDLCQKVIDPLAIAHIGRSLAQALAHAHRQGVLHGDLALASVYQDQWKRTGVRINNVQLPPDMDYFTAAAQILNDEPVPFDPAPSIRNDLRAGGVILWSLAIGQQVNPHTVHEGWHQATALPPDALRHLIERLVIPTHALAVTTAEEMVSACEACIREMQTPRVATSLPPWESADRQPYAFHQVPTHRPTDQTIPEMPAATAVNDAAAFASPLPPVQPHIIGGQPGESTNEALTWVNASPESRNIDHPPPAIRPAQGRRFNDLLLWIAISIGIFLFWLIVGYLVPGLFGK